MAAGGRVPGRIVTLLLGIDEGTSAVKAVLYDEELQPVAEARREKPLAHPQPGWVEQDPEVVLDAVVDAVAELLDGASEQVSACGLDHQGESVLAWDAESGRAADPDRDLAGQALAGGPRPARVRRSGPRRSRERSGMPLDPYFSAGKLAWLLEHDAGGGQGARRRHAAARHRRLLPLRPARRRLRHRPLDRLAHPARGPATRVGPAAARDLRRPRARRCRRSRTPPETSARCSHPSWPVELPLRARCVDQQAALAGAGCVEPGPGQGDLRHRRLRARPRRRRAPASPSGGLLPTVAWRVDGRGRVRARRRRVHRRRAARMAQPRPRPRRRPARARRAGGARSRTRAASACCRRWPASARPGGSPRRGR